MSLKQQLLDDMKAAMKDRENGKLALAVIRMIRASIKNVEINEKRELQEEEVLAVLVKEMKMRRDALHEFEQAGRQDLADQTKAEMAILEKYLPQQLSEDDVRQVVRSILAEHSGEALQMGAVMKLVMPKLKGQADGSVISRIVKEELA